MQVALFLNKVKIAPVRRKRRYYTLTHYLLFPKKQNRSSAVANEKCDCQTFQTFVFQNATTLINKIHNFFNKGRSSFYSISYDGPLSILDANTTSQVLSFRKLLIQYGRLGNWYDLIEMTYNF